MSYLENRRKEYPPKRLEALARRVFRELCEVEMSEPSPNLKKLLAVVGEGKAARLIADCRVAYLRKARKELG